MMRRTTGLIFSSVLVSALLIILPPAYPADPLAQQQDAIARIEAFIEYFRKTGDFKSRVGDLQQAERELAASVEAFTDRNDLASAALSLVRLGQIQRMQGKWDVAIAFYQKAESAAVKANHIAYRAKALVGRAQAEAQLRDYGAAAAHAELAVQLSALAEDKRYLFDALDVSAQIQISQGNYNAAAERLNRALLLAAALKDESLLFNGCLDRADVYLKISEKCDYQRDFDPCFQALERARQDYKEALSLARKLGWTGLARQTEDFLKEADMRAELIKSQQRAHTTLQKADLFHPKGPSDVLVTERFSPKASDIPPMVTELYRESQRFKELAGGFASSVGAREFYVQGMIEQMQGNHDAALASFQKAVEVLEQDRRRLNDEASRGTFLEDKIIIYYAPILELLERRRFGEAFDLMERSRARAMADLLATRDLSLARETERNLYAEWVKLRTSIAMRQTELFRLVNSGATPEKIGAADREIMALEESNRELTARMAREAPRLLELTASRPVSLADLQALMKQEQFDVLEYLVLEHGIILWHIGPDAVHVRNVFLPRTEVIEKVAALQSSLADRNREFDQRTARELFLFLIQPALAWIKTSWLVVIPHDALHAVSFEVLQDPKDGSYLGERYQISYAPSATIHAGLKKPVSIAGGRLLAVADPSIPEAEDEVQAIARLYPGRSKVFGRPLATEAEVKAPVSGYSVVHFSVHGKFNSAEPMLSYLKLARGGPDDGLLTAAEMFGLPLDNTSLVALSACETGKAEATYGNELLGMMRALLYAGATTLVLSYWKVDSASTALWMETFYRAAHTQPASEAARLALAAVKRRPEYSHPYYWGAFMLIGR